MDLDTFISRRQPGWKSLENGLHRAEQAGLDSLPVEDLKRMGELYRAACSDLTYAKTVLQNGELSDYLNTIVGQAYAAIYRKSRYSLMGALRWMVMEYPAAVRKNGVAILVAWLATFAGFAGGFAAVWNDRAAFEAIVPSNYHTLYGQKPKTELREARFGKIDADQSAGFSSHIYSNNIRVCFMSFAFGGSFGILTLVLLLYNGALLGAIAANFHRWDLDLDFWSLIVPHGVLEFSCIAVTGGAGLALGWSLIRPGRLTRGESFAAAGRSAVPVALGTAPLLVIAGIVEGFLTPAVGLSPWLKISFGMVLGGAYWVWILLPALPKLGRALQPAPEIDSAVVSGLVTAGPGGATRRLSKSPRSGRDRVTTTGGGGMNTSVTTPPAWLSRTFVVTTPEAVDFEYEIAGPGHRLLAWLIDAVIIVALLFFAAIVAGIIMLATGSKGLGGAVFNTSMLIASNGYFMLCEHFMNGQTPGKRVAGIRVLDSRGFRITFSQSAIRNLFRFIDALPFLYAVGGATMLLNRHGLRLGDLAAGTVVVRVPRIPAPERLLPAGQREESLLGDFALGERVRKILRAPEKDLLVSLAVRRDRLEASARLKVFEKAAEWFEERLELPKPPMMSAETYVLNLAAIAHAPRDRAAGAVRGAAR